MYIPPWGLPTNDVNQPMTARTRIAAGLLGTAFMIAGGAVSYQLNGMVKEIEQTPTIATAHAVQKKLPPLFAKGLPASAEAICREKNEATSACRDREEVKLTRDGADAGRTLGFAFGALGIGFIVLAADGGGPGGNNGGGGSGGGTRRREGDPHQRPWEPPQIIV